MRRAQSPPAPSPGDRRRLAGAIGGLPHPVVAHARRGGGALRPPSTTNEVSEGSMTVLRRFDKMDGKRIATSFLGEALIDLAMTPDQRGWTPPIRPAGKPLACSDTGWPYRRRGHRTGVHQHRPGTPIVPACAGSDDGSTAHPCVASVARSVASRTTHSLEPRLSPFP